MEKQRPRRRVLCQPWRKRSKLNGRERNSDDDNLRCKKWNVAVVVAIERVLCGQQLILALFALAARRCYSCTKQCIILY